MIVPCIDLMDGKVVQLVQGREKALEGDSPDEMLRKFAAFPEIQVIDLDAALGRGSNGDCQEAVPRLNRGTLWVRPLGPPPPPSDAPDLAYTMSAEPPTPAQPDSVTFRANGGIDT